MHFDVDNSTIFLGFGGSHAYGTAISTSDIDVKGVCITPKYVRDSFYLNFEQFESRKQKGSWGKISEKAIDVIKLHKTGGISYENDNQVIDLVIYSLSKFVKLAANANPNILELLFLDENDVLYSNKFWKELIKHRDLFLSKKCRHTYMGYAHSQLKRIKRHREWLLNPPKGLPERKDFGLPDENLIPHYMREQITAHINKKVSKWMLEDGLDAEITGAGLDELKERLRNFYCELIKCDDSRLTDSLFVIGSESIEISDCALAYIRAEKLYREAKRHYKHYQKWKDERNPERAKLEEKFGYDCYSDDTEFLTDSGWKLFDEITLKDKLATFYVGDAKHKQNFPIEYQNYLDRFSGIYSGPMYQIKGYHIDTLITPNHNVFTREVSRNTGKKNSWQLKQISSVGECFDILMHPSIIKRQNKKYDFDDLNINSSTYMKIMGWFLSDGTFQIGKNKNPKAIAITQVKKQELYHGLQGLHASCKEKLNSRLKTYSKISNINGNPILERRFTIWNKDVVNKLYCDCGHKQFKRIPKYVFNLGIKDKNILMKSLLQGDGTYRNTPNSDSWVYYTKSNDLADDVQWLAVTCGYHSTKMGPHKSNTCDMYQVHIRKDVKQYKNLNRYKNISKVNVENKRVVCFTTPNATLITRRNGRIGFHGNSKHAMHLIRLVRSGIEIIRDGSLKVRRDDAQELLDIRNGVYTYDEILKHAEECENKMSELVKDSSLPKGPDFAKIDQIMKGIVWDFDKERYCQ